MRTQLSRLALWGLAQGSVPGFSRYYYYCRRRHRGTGKRAAGSGRRDPRSCRRTRASARASRGAVGPGRREGRRGAQRNLPASPRRPAGGERGAGAGRGGAPHPRDAPANQAVLRPRPPPPPPPSLPPSRRRRRHRQQPPAAGPVRPPARRMALRGFCSADGSDPFWVRARRPPGPRGPAGRGRPPAGRPAGEGKQRAGRARPAALRAPATDRSRVAPLCSPPRGWGWGSAPGPSRVPLMAGGRVETWASQFPGSRAGALHVPCSGALGETWGARAWGRGLPALRLPLAIKNNLPRKGTPGMGGGGGQHRGLSPGLSYPIRCGLGSPLSQRTPLPKGLSWKEARGLWEGMFAPFPVVLPQRDSPVVTYFFCHLLLSVCLLNYYRRIWGNGKN